MTAEEEYTLEVRSEEEKFSLKHFMFRTPLGIMITLVIILALLVIAVRVWMGPPAPEPPSMTTASSDELVNWAEDVLNQ